MKFHFCQSDRYKIHTHTEFKRTCALIARSNESALIHFVSGKLCSHENLMPVLNFISVKMTDLKSITSRVSFRLSCERTLKQIFRSAAQL